ncbi:MAG: MaoC family dehydratase [Myxococcota bacterium]|nr:MaoC family dehydratase [Myxococcota bacterium]
MSEALKSKQAGDISVGDSLPEFSLNVTPAVIVAGAIASRDFMPAHHDPAYAKGQGAPDVFMNILTTNGYVSRFVTDWAGPESMIRKIAIRLGAPAIPGQPLRFNGQVVSKNEESDECVLELEVRAANDLGDHATGTVVVTIPLG